MNYEKTERKTLFSVDNLEKWIENGFDDVTLSRSNWIQYKWDASFNTIRNVELLFDRKIEMKRMKWPWPVHNMTADDISNAKQ